MKTRKTNIEMYKEIAALYNGKEMDYEVINNIFDLENRTEQDLKNLREYIVATGKNDLATMLTQAIDSVLVMID